MKLFRKCYIRRLIRNSIFNFIPERERKKSSSKSTPFRVEKPKSYAVPNLSPFPSLSSSPKTRRKKEKMSARIHIHASFSARWSVHGRPIVVRTQKLGSIGSRCMHARTGTPRPGTKVGQYWQMRRYICQALSAGVGVTHGRAVIASIVWCAAGPVSNPIGRRLLRGPANSSAMSDTTP